MSAMDGALPGWALPLLYALALWWAATGVILYLDGLPRRTFRLSMTVASALAIAALAGLQHSAQLDSALGSYCGFTSALVVWGWMEMSFLMGWVTGPRKHACAAGCDGVAHFRHATEAIIHHELAIAGGALLIYLLTLDAANATALHSYLLLWGMRLSAKLNLHFGVRNFSEEFLPPHLLYLKSFFRRRRMNALWPLSIVAGSALTGELIGHAAAAVPGSADAVALTLLATMAGLAVVEHLFMVLPLPFNAIWNWGLKSRAREEVKPL